VNETSLTLAIEDVIRSKEEAVDNFMEEIIEPLEHIGNPEKLIGKPYGTWTPEDLQRMSLIYGSSPDSPLQKFIFNREYQYLKELEAGV
jgi:hypothetical protein